MLARVPWGLPVKPALPRKSLNKDRKRHLVEVTGAILKRGEPTRFAFEASCRHGIRSALCLQGWKWELADLVAAEIVASALAQIGAARPTWKEGQPEWTQDGALPIERERCIRCRKPLPEGHWKFCSAVCNNAHHALQDYYQRRDEHLARKKAERAAWIAAQPKRVCESCFVFYKPKNPKQRFCSKACSLERFR